MTPEERAALEDYVAHKAVASDVLRSAVRAALAPPPTCGTCQNWMTNHGSGWDKRHPCHFYGGVPRTADDGCILGYAPTEPTR